MNSSSGRRPGHKHRPSKKRKMSDQEWAKCLATFQGVVDNEASDDRSILAAWDILRQDYKNKFNAKVSAHSAQQNEEPFSLWAAENLNDLTLERVLCLVFRKELAECNHMTLLRSTAAKADTTVWHILLYFGASMLSESMLGKVRKRLRVFDKDPVTGASTFKTAYLNVLQATARRTKMALDTTSVVASNAVRVFTSSDLAALASANPEFDPPSRKIGGASSSLKAEGRGGHLAASIDRNMGKPKGTDMKKTKNSGANATNQIREDGLGAGGEPIKQSIEFNVPDRLPGRAGQFPTEPRLLSSDSNGQRSNLPSVPPARPGAPGGVITRRNPPRKGRPGSMHIGIAATDTGKTPDDDGENAATLEIKPQSSSTSGASSSTGEQPPTRVGSTIHCAPAMPPVSSKRPLKIQDNGAAESGRETSKRPKNTPTHDDLVDDGRNWDDKVVLTILKQLEAAGQSDFVLVDGMSDDNFRAQSKITGAASMRGSLIVPLKVEGGQRFLVVVDLDTQNNQGEGVLKYFDPYGPPDEDALAKYAPAAKLAQLLSHVLPDRDLNPSLWKSEFCVCPELSREADSGLSICLWAMYAVGGRPIPNAVDWMFWRNIMLGAFFPDYGAVQLRVARYREEIVHKLIRQGQMSDSALVPQGRRVSSDIEYLGTAAMNPVDRIECRADNTKKIIGVIHEGLRIFMSLQEKVDTAKADLKTRLDKSTHIRDSLRRKLNIGDQIVLGEPLPKVEDGDETTEAFDKLTLQQAIEEHAFCTAHLDGISACRRSIHQALAELGFWRHDVNAAVMEDDASILDKRGN